MRLISDVDWAEFFESVSLVDDVLRSGSDFAQLDFATRNLYRGAIEKLARGAPLTEVLIAQAALDAAAADCRTSARARDPGYHLIAAGRPRLRSGNRLSRLDLEPRRPLQYHRRRASITSAGSLLIAALILSAALLGA